MSSKQMKLFAVSLAVASAAWFALWMFWLGVQYSGGKLDLGAVLIGLLLFAFPPAAAGVVASLLISSKASKVAREEEEATLVTRVAEAVKTRGKVSMNTLARELGTEEKRIRRAVEKLASMKLLDLVVDWRRGEVTVAGLVGGTCPKCGGRLEPAGAGLLVCAYCGSKFPANERGKNSDL